MLLTIGATSAWAQTLHYQYNYIGVNNTGDFYSEGDARKLLDNQEDNSSSANSKWCVVQNGRPWNSTISVTFSTDSPIIPVAYVFYPGYDTGHGSNTYPGRNPKSWTVYAGNSSSGPWTVLDSKSDVSASSISTTNSTEFTFTNTTAYQYFKFEVTATQNSSSESVFQLGEFRFKVSNGGGNGFVLNQNLNEDLTCGGSTYNFYDSGGASGEYNNNESYTAIFTCTGDITITFNSFAVESYSSSWDYLTLYDGETQIAKLGGNGSNISGNITTATSYTATSGTLKAVWKSDNSNVRAGWNATITTGTCRYITEIRTVADWKAFCSAVNNGHDYYGETVTLMNDITTAVTTMAGTISGDAVGNAFKGTFDGQGHTLTLDISGGASSGWYFTAPFRCIDGATIKNLKTAGTVTQTGGKGAAGIVGCSIGACTITNCVSNVTINSQTIEDGTHGGFISYIKSNSVTFNGCAFTGSITGSSTRYCGGFVGWNNGTATFNNCVFAPTAITFDADHSGDNSANFSRNGGTFNNCYYTQTCGSVVQGKLMHSITGASGITVANAGSATSYTPETSTIVGYGTGIKFNNILYAGDGDNVQLNITYSGSLSGYALVVTNGTLSGTTNPYTLAKGTGNTVISVLQKKYRIANTESTTQMTWAQFAALVNSGVSYSGETVYLDENITTAVTVAVGTGSDGSTPFSGTFDGQDHTLNVNIPSSGNAGNAPFKHIVGATIKNLVVEGTVNETNRHAAGLVGYSWSGTNTIENCWVKTNVTSDNDYAGGIIGHGKTSNIVMRGCVYSGTITATGTNPVGGLVGWSDVLTGLTIEDCFFNGNYSNSSSSRKFHPIGCTGNAGNITATRTVTNTYYTLDHSNLNATTQTLVYNLSDKGKFAYTITGQGTVTVDNAGTAHTYSASGITSYGTGILFDDVLYAGDGDEVSLTLNGSSISYDADYGTLTGSGSSWTLAMEAHNTQISASNCYAPTNLTVSGINANGAKLTWEGGDAGYNVELGTASTTTGTVVINSEGFETGLGDWTVTTDNNDYTWARKSGTGHSNYTTVGEGSYNVGAYKNSRVNTYTYLTLNTDLSSYTDIKVSFKYINPKWGNDIDIIYVQYSTDGSTYSNVENGSYTGGVSSWTQVTELPIPSGTKFIRFAAWGNYGYGVGLDAIQVTGTGDIPTTTWSNFASNVTSPYTFNGETGTEYLVRVSSTCGQVSNEVTFTPQTLTYEFTNADGTDNANWDELTNWQYSNPDIAVTTLPTINDDVQIKAACTIPSECIAQANSITLYTDEGTGYVYGSITIENGGQLQHNNGDVAVTIERVIPAYLQENEETNLGYKIISFPVSGIYQEDECIEGLLTANPYDFYTFEYNNLEENVYLEWRHVSNNDVLDPYKGYLYASQNGTTISVKGQVAPSVNQDYPLDYEEGVAPFNGWKLVGNPFVCNAYLTANGGNLDFYEIEDYTQSGYAEFSLNDNTVAIPPMGGVMVRVKANDNLVYSRTAAPTGSKGGILNMNVNKLIATKDGASTETIDRARLRFGQGRNLEKLQLNPRHTKLYIPEGGNDYAVYYAEGAGTIPVNFKAQDNGRYTLDFSTEDVGFNYLHLIDNMNGNDVDLLQTPYYTFDAKSTDFASRFTLVFATGSSTGSETGNFAFFNNGVWIINNPSTGSGAEATLQVVDVLGHILSSETISGSCSKAINVAPGVYMLRLVNGNDVKVQKIVVR